MTKGTAWFSELKVRNLTAHIAPRIYPHVEAAVHQAIRQTIDTHLPGLLMEALRAELPDAVPKHPASFRRDRANAIRAEWNGTNTRALATKYGVNMRYVQRIIKGK